eukprot:4003608-Pleurochrysis_carterae.AAC.2
MPSWNVRLQPGRRAFAWHYIQVTQIRFGTEDHPLSRVVHAWFAMLADRLRQVRQGRVVVGQHLRQNSEEQKRIV